MEQAKAAAEKRGSKPQRAFAGGRALFVLLWLAGPAAVAAMAAGWLPGSAALTAVILLGLCVSIAVGVLWQRSGLLARPLIAVENAGQRLALTFDDGPDPEVTPRVLEALRAAGE